MSQTLGIKFRDYGQVYFFDSGPFVVRLGDYVIVRTEQGMGLGQVVVLPREGDPLGASVSAAGPLEEVPPLPADGQLAAFEPLDQTGELLDLAMEPGVPEEPDLPAAAAEAADLSGNGEEATDGAVGDESAGEDGGDRDLKPIYRLASDQDLGVKTENDALARDAHGLCRRCISERNLDMKLVDVEVFFDRSKMVFYFTAPGRIDFRELVKDLVKAYRTRIELRQIGVRHETQMIGAVGNCGMVCCCRRYMRKFVPVTIKMAKEQNLFLNPTKISGICGRLLCCLAFEEKNYEEFYRQCPKIGKRLDTDMGVVKVLRANFFRGTLSVLPEYGEEKEFSIEEWKALNPRRYDPQAQPRRPPEYVPAPAPAAASPAAPAPAPAPAPIPEAPAPSAPAAGPAGERGASRRPRNPQRRRPPREDGPAPVAAAPAPAPAPAPDPDLDLDEAPAGEAGAVDPARRSRPRRRRKRRPRGQGQ